MKHGKKYSDSLKLIDHLKQYDPDEAVDLVNRSHAKAVKDPERKRTELW